MSAPQHGTMWTLGLEAKVAHLDTVEILDRLVGFPTVSNQSNLELIDWVGNYLKDHGIEFWLDWHRGKKKTSLFALVGPRVAGGVVLSGHSDVVPVTGQDWRTDPWILTERDGRYYGRGTCDMKGFMAVVLSRVTAADLSRLQRPIQIALSRDEEIGCLGALPMIVEMSRQMPPASAAIIGEPTGMQVVDCHKGGRVYEVKVHGHSVHSSVPHRGVSAVMVAAHLIDGINQENRSMAERKPTETAARFDPSCSTLHVGRIRGGTARNITAGQCRFDLELRYVPDDDPEKIICRFLEHVCETEEKMQRISPAARIALRGFADTPPLVPENRGAAERLALEIAGQTIVHAVPYITEAGLFQEGYCSSVVCGPGDIAQAHCADEYIAADQLRQCEAFVDGVIAHLSE